MKLVGTMPTLSIPITDEFRPNAFVSVVLIRGRSRARPHAWNAADVGAPAFRVGYANLRINPEARRLAITVSPNKRDYRPGERAKVNLQVKDRHGKGARAEVTLYAVDEGVLMLTGYKTPDPIPVFSEPRLLQVGFSESRSALARLTMSAIDSPAGPDKGLDGGGGGAARRDFRQTAYFNPSIVTDEAGRAQVSFRLPQGLTTYRIMAVGVARDDRFGYADAEVTTSQPLMARPAFPRLLRAGDEIHAGVVVSSKGLPKTSVEVRTQVDGLEIVGDAHRTIEIGSGESREVTFAFRARRVGKAKLRFSVEGGGESDTVEFGKPIKAPTTLEAVALYGATRTEGGERLGNLSAMRSDVGDLEISVASTALVGLGGSIDQLIDYPYECTEQLTSRLVPLVPLRSLARDFALPMPPNTKQLISSTVAKIVKRQRPDGGFGVWSESTRSNPWVSAYALWGLGLAARGGVTIPKRVLKNGTKYLRSYLERRHDEPLGEVVAAFMVDVLAEQGKPDHGYMNRLFEKRTGLPLFGRALLAHAIAVGKGNKKSLSELVRDIEAHVRVQGNQATVAENVGNQYAELMDSSVRTSALVLRALLATRPNHTLAERLTRGLLQARKGGHWASTQENAYALIALDEYRKAQEKAVPNFLASGWLGEDRLFEKEMAGRTVKAFHAKVPASRLHRASGATLAFQMGGEKKGTLFYEARLRYARKELPRDAVDRGFYVEKSMRVVTPKGLATAIRTVPGPGTRLPVPRGGELVLVDLMVVSPQPHDFVVIDDPLPAGLEGIDSSLATSAQSLDVSGTGGEDFSLEGAEDMEEYDDRIARGDALLPSWFRREMRDDRVLYFVDHMAAGMYHYRYLTRATTVGRFMLPATKAEAMYQPEIFGRSAGKVFQVKAQ